MSKKVLSPETQSQILSYYEKQTKIGSALIPHVLRVEGHALTKGQDSFHINYPKFMVRGYKLPHILSVERDDALKYGEVLVIQQIKNRLMKISKKIKFTPQLSLTKCHIDETRVSDSWLKKIAKRFCNVISLRLPRGQATEAQITKFIKWLKYSRRLKNFTYISNGEHVIKYKNRPDLNKAYRKLCYILYQIRIDNFITTDISSNKTFIKGLANLEKFDQSLKNFKLSLAYGNSNWCYTYQEAKNSPFIQKKLGFTYSNLEFAWDTHTLLSKNNKCISHFNKETKSFSRLLKIIGTLNAIPQENNKAIFNRQNFPKAIELIQSSTIPFSGDLLRLRISMKVQFNAENFPYGQQTHDKSFSLFNKNKKMEKNLYNSKTLVKFLELLQQSPNLELLQIHLSLPELFINTSMESFYELFGVIFNLKKLKKLELISSIDAASKYLTEELNIDESLRNSRGQASHALLDFILGRMNSIPETKLNFRSVNIINIYFSSEKVNPYTTFPEEEFIFSPKTLYLAEINYFFVEKAVQEEKEKVSCSKTFNKLNTSFSLLKPKLFGKSIDIVAPNLIEESFGMILFKLMQIALEAELKDFKIEFVFQKFMNCTKLGTLERI